MNDKNPTIMKKKVLVYFPLLAMASLGMVSCSEDNAIGDNVSKKWQDALSGQSDAKQSWVTAVNMQLDIVAQKGGQVRAYSIGNETPVLLGQKDMQGNGVMRLDVPQGIGNSIGLIYDGNGTRQYQRIYLSNDNQQTEDVDFITGTNTSTVPEELSNNARGKAKTRVVSTWASTALPTPTGTHNSSLDGNSVAAINGYTSFGGWAWEALLNALPEAKAAKQNNPDGISYEFTSDGYQGQGKYGDNTIVTLTYLYGYTGCSDSRILGYYTHSDGTYADLELHDLGEALTKDYLASPGSTDYQAKVQYQLDGNNKWYDANFWYTDGEGVLKNEYGNVVTATGKGASRNGDGNFNTYLVHNNYGDRVSAMRGLSYKINIKKGLKYGFYLRLVGQAMNDAQKSKLQAKGADLSKVGTYGINFSNADLNVSNNNSNSNFYRSSYKKYDNFSFVGLDDTYIGGDMDCNDVTFGFLDADGKPGPHEFNESDELQSWTIGYENQGMDLDFDFNDAVIKVTPNPATHKAKVELLAAGGVYNTELYYGQTKLCEVHEAFGLKPNSNGLYDMVNTGEGTSSLSTVNLGEVDWPSDYTMSDNGSLFHTKVTTDKGKVYTASPGNFIGENNDVPTAVCIAGDWAWPIERTNIFEAYPLIGKWGKNVKNTDYWNWYAQPKNDKVMSAK